MTNIFRTIKDWFLRTCRELIEFFVGALLLLPIIIILLSPLIVLLKFADKLFAHSIGAGLNGFGLILDLIGFLMLFYEWKISMRDPEKYKQDKEDYWKDRATDKAEEHDIRSSARSWLDKYSKYSPKEYLSSIRIRAYNVAFLLIIIGLFLQIFGQVLQVDPEWSSYIAQKLSSVHEIIWSFILMCLLWGLVYLFVRVEP